MEFNQVIDFDKRECLFTELTSQLGALEKECLGNNPLQASSAGGYIKAYFSQFYAAILVNKWNAHFFTYNIVPNEANGYLKAYLEERKKFEDCYKEIAALAALTESHPKNMPDMRGVREASERAWQAMESVLNPVQDSSYEMFHSAGLIFFQSLSEEKAIGTLVEREEELTPVPFLLEETSPLIGSLVSTDESSESANDEEMEVSEEDISSFKLK